MKKSVTGRPATLFARESELQGLRLIARCEYARFAHSRSIPLRALAFALMGLASAQPVTGFAESDSAPKPAISVLDFELNDLTLTPGLEEEKERTASIAPLLREILEARHDFKIRAIDSNTQAAADEAFGYIYEHHDVAAELGREAASDLIVVGRVHKASFLFVYFKAKIIDTKTTRLLSELSVEVKGSQKRLTAKGVETLAEQIAARIDAESVDGWQAPAKAGEGNHGSPDP